MTSPEKQNPSEFADTQTAGSNTIGESLSSRLSHKTRLQNQCISQTEQSAITQSNDSPPSSQDRIDTKLGIDQPTIKVKEEPIASVILSSPKTMNTFVKSPSLSHPTSPPPTDNDTSISSSPRSASPDVEIRPPAQRKIPPINISSPCKTRSFCGPCNYLYSNLD